MAEPSKDRDKAVERGGYVRFCQCTSEGHWVRDSDSHGRKPVTQDAALEEALHWVTRDRGTVLSALNLLWQRAQEAEREECAKLVEQHTEHVEFDAFTEDEEPGTKLQSHLEPPYICSIAQAIRNRAARASEEPKP